LGLTAVSAITLHQVFENQAVDQLNERARILAQGAAAFLSSRDTAEGADRLAELLAWLESDPDFESIRLLGENGNVLFASRGAAPSAPHAAGASHLDSFVAAARAMRGTSTLQAEVALSSVRLARDLENIRWLSMSIALLAGAMFAALSIYLTRGFVLPLEQIRRAAHRIANGELNVRVPVSGDWELDQFAHDFQSLAERRTASVSPTLRPKQELPAARSASRSAEG
jgi:methyl-accepting chemotaxis protein